jgi:hypothetical protein
MMGREVFGGRERELGGLQIERGCLLSFFMRLFRELPCSFTAMSTLSPPMMSGPFSNFLPSAKESSLQCTIFQYTFPKGKLPSSMAEPRLCWESARLRLHCNCCLAWFATSENEDHMFPSRSAGALQGRCPHFRLACHHVFSPDCSCV